MDRVDILERKDDETPKPKIVNKPGMYTDLLLEFKSSDSFTPSKSGGKSENQKRSRKY